jgi:hypothetical protein
MKTATATSRTDSHFFTKYVGSFKAKPRHQQLLSLGNFSTEHPPKGFAIDMETPVSTEKNVITNFITQGGSKRYELMLEIINNTGRTVSVEVWSL